jgi:RNA polymerase sigma-70 factor (ECF subfamily)
MEQDEMSGCVQQYVAQLSDQYRAVILLHDTQGLTNPEIAEMLDLSLATVKIRLHRARKRLRETLDRACSFSHDDRGVLICEPKAGDDTC